MKKTFLFYSLIITPFLFLMYKIHLKKILTFGCFDDCFNITTGYFIKNGKLLYSDIFFNHQPLMAYISFAVQSITDPINIFALILFHRKFILIFSIIMNLFIAARFRFAGLGFILFYEATKLYVFGDRFLAESVIIYPLVYLLGLLWYKLNKNKIYPIEYLISAFFVWFIIFLREPFVPLALILFGLIIWPFNKNFRAKITAVIFLILLSSFMLLKLPLKDYIFNVLTVNRALVLTYPSDNFLYELFKIFLYPVYILVEGHQGFFRTILIGASFLFISLGGFLAIFLKKWKTVGLIVFILGLANVRYSFPGKPFYEAFHIAPWYGMFIFSIFLFLGSLWNEKILRRARYLFILALIILFSYAVSPSSVLWEKNDLHADLINNYGQYLSNGEVAKILALPGSTLFVDGFDELIYWQAKLPSSYKYSWYTSVMPKISLYSEKRMEMFKNNPPDIYYGSCPKEKADFRLIPDEQKSLYVNLQAFGGPTCLYLKKENLNKISEKQWQKAKEFGFDIIEK